ncbi:MAG: M14 family metallopeptidase [Bacteroidota bacterium]
MRHYFLTAIFLMSLLSCKEQIEKDEQNFTTTYEKSDGNETATYQETIDFYLRLAKAFPEVNVQTIGSTDSGKPLHLVTFNPDGNFNFQKIREDKTVLFINNGIHPGEPDGIDAAMLLFRDLALNKLPVPKNVVLATIPVYNIGGMENRNSTTRVNQNGPNSYGFRGNARNYDLNRDFVKMDTENARTFTTIFHLVKPDVFIDTHVSNGADYQYTLTHLFTQHNKLGGALGRYLNESFVPALDRRLAAANWDTTPYVNVFNSPPDNGFSQFMDHPRYSTGYTTLWGTLGMMIETHMLKPHKKRVMGTYELIKEMLAIVDEDHQQIKELRSKYKEDTLAMEHYPRHWAIDTTATTPFLFKGYAVDTVISPVTGLPRLKYDRTRPFEKTIPFSNNYIAKDTLRVPSAYVIRKGWQKIIDRLIANEIAFFALEKDTIATLEQYHITDYQTYQQAYEGHYPHYNTKVTAATATIHLQKGDYIVPTAQEGIRYLLETLEPEAVDSFFNWNFFDTILQQKEGISPYVFEDIALQLLQENPKLQELFEQQKLDDPEFAAKALAQLQWIYEHSKYLEAAYLHYPVYRIKRGSKAEFLLK